MVAATSGGGGGGGGFISAGAQIAGDPPSTTVVGGSGGSTTGAGGAFFLLGKSEATAEPVTRAVITPARTSDLDMESSFKFRMAPYQEPYGQGLRQSGVKIKAK
jgi:hypothetical protein